MATDGSALPSARAVSVAIFGAGDKPLSTATLALMQFGQFINHDFQSSAQFTFCKKKIKMSINSQLLTRVLTTAANGTDISCCSSTGGSLDASELHPACLPIEVAIDDKFFNKNKVTKTCMNFVRSIAGPRLDCSLGYADQVNRD